MQGNIEKEADHETEKHVYLFIVRFNDSGTASKLIRTVKSAL
jgi:hypothetical protein